MNQPTSSARLPASSDRRIMFVGIAAILALAVYLAVAFLNTHTTPLPVTAVNKVAPWTPWGSNLTPIRRRKSHDYVVRVTRAPGATALGAYGALVPTLIPVPSPGTRFVVGLWLKEARPGRVGVQIQEFRSGRPSRYLVNKTVPVTRGWHHVDFRGRVKGSWTGVSLYLYRLLNVKSEPWFALRNLTVRVG